MNDTYHCYRAIKRALVQCFGHLWGRRARHLRPWWHSFGGIIGSYHTRLPKIADHAPGRGPVVGYDDSGLPLAVGRPVEQV